MSPTHGLATDCVPTVSTSSAATCCERRFARELKLYAQRQGQGFPGSYARVTEFIRAWRLEQGAVSARTAYVALSFAWGEAFQFDWSEEGLVIGGVWWKVQLAHMKLCASLAFWLVG